MQRKNKCNCLCHKIQEKWLSIIGYKNYKISNSGIVKSYHFNKERSLKYSTNKKGYYLVVLCENGLQKTFSVHRLVAKHFKENYSPDLQINHIDGDKKNNNCYNLELVTCKENIIHSYKIGLSKIGEKRHNSKLTKKESEEIRLKYNSGLYSHRKLAKIYNISRGSIYSIIKNKSWINSNE